MLTLFAQDGTISSSNYIIGLFVAFFNFKHRFCYSEPFKMKFGWNFLSGTQSKRHEDVRRVAADVRRVAASCTVNTALCY